MELNNIINELNKRFAKPLDEFYKRRIIFWKDDSSNPEFVNEIDTITLENAKIVKLTGNNNFEIKKLLSHDDLTNNYLVYDSVDYDMEEDWLLDIKLFSEDFRADKTSIWMKEMNIQDTALLRKTVKEYVQFFKAATRRNLVANFNNDIESPGKLHMTILAAICGVNTIDPKDIIKNVMLGGPDLENNIKLDLLKYSASERFWQLVKQKTGYDGTSIDDMNKHIVLSAASRTLPQHTLLGFEDKYSSIHDGFCYDLIFDWMHSDKKEDLKEIIHYVENSLKLKNRFEQFDIVDLIDTECLPIIDEIILNKIMYQITSHTMNIKDTLSILEKRRTMVWNDSFDAYYTGIYFAINIEKFYEEHLDGFHIAQADKLWKAYTDEYYVIDTYYRQFHIAFSNSMNSSISELDDNYKLVAEEVEKIYKNWFLGKLSENWTKVIENDLKDYGYIAGIKRQDNFYTNNVESTKNKTYVIISDALRYEVASSIAEQLRIETKSEVELDSQQAIFPTITKFGMAALLPHKKLSLENKSNVLRVMTDGQTTEAIDRDKILKNKNENSIAIKYTDFIKLKKDERVALVKGKEVIYFYHDVIDNASHSDDQRVFNACDTAITEIKNLVNIITNQLSGINVFITADHGFLYTYNPLNEDDKMERSPFKNDILEQGRRYIITDDQANPDYLLPVKGFYNDNEYQVFVPRENIRIKGAGGQNFVHGGASLQEMVVPVIKYTYLRSSYKKYETNKDKYDAKPVTISLLSSNRKVSNMIFNLSFYQKEPVKNNYVPCNYDLFFVDSQGQTVSDKQKIVADRTNENTKDREYKCTFNLKQMKFDNTEIYYLMIQDASGIQLPIKEEFQIDIAVSLDEFDFFA